MMAKDQVLFGGDRPWNEADWTDSDDRVRGGKSQSYLQCSKAIGRFTGVLDIKTLGGAGFASQRTTGEDKEWDLSGHAGISLDVTEWDSKRYTFILKDALLPRDPKNGRDQATTSYEYNFTIPEATHASKGKDEGKSTQVFMPWSALKPTYRGKEQKDAEPLNLKSIKRMSIMMRSFFGDQHGDFSLSIRSIKAVTSSPITCRALEEGHASTAHSKSHWRRWSRALTLVSSPWRVCGCALLVLAIYYTQGVLSSRK